MKSRGDALLASMTTTAVVDGDTGTTWLDRVAAAYDKAVAADLPADVEAFVSEVEDHANRNGYGPRAYIRRLVAIVREQALRIKQISESEQTVIDAAMKARFDLEAMAEESDALRDRLAELEAALTHAVNHLEDANDTIESLGADDEEYTEETRTWIAMTRDELLNGKGGA